MRAPTRPLARLVLVAVVVATGPVLSACESLDTFDIFDSKKKLTGDRKPVFPDGVPGVASGVPPELVKGYLEQEGGSPDPAKAAAEAAAEPAAKPSKPKPQTKPAPQRTASKPAPKPSAQSDVNAAAPTRAAAPDPAQQPAQQAGGTAPWPAAQPQAAWPSAPGAVAR
jgi:hypothetical protein